MSFHNADELREFHLFLGAKVKSGGVSMSPEEILDEWRSLHPAPDSEPEDAAAIQEALNDMEAGDAGSSFEEFDREFRKDRKLPPRS